MTAARKSPARTLLVTVLVITGLVVLGLVSLVFLFPADQLRAQFERRVSEATGYTVTVRDLKLGWAGFGVALTARDLSAVSGDGSQTLTAPAAVLRVALGPLLRRQIVLTRASVDGALLAMGPPTRKRPGTPPGAAGGSGQNGSRGFIAPKIVVTNSRIVQEGTSGTTTFFGVNFDGSFRLGSGDGARPAGGSSATGLFKGRFSADSTAFAPRATPEKPLRLPPLEMKFTSSLRFEPQSATTDIDGRWGDWPGKGTVESVYDSALDGWRNSGQVELETVDLKKLGSFVEAAGPALAAYELGGKLEDGRLHFETRPDREEMVYDLTTRLSGVKASLPGRGEVVRDGRGDVHVQPDNLNFKGSFKLGRAALDVDAHVTSFQAPKWTADIALKGPAEEALRFLPPDQALNATGGTIDADVRVSGAMGQTGLPEASGTVRIEKMSLRHPALAVPVDRLDFTATFLFNSARIENGFVSAGRSSARFDGSIADFRKPEAVLNVDAGDLDLDQLLPKTPGASPGAGGEPSGGPGTSSSGSGTASAGKAGAGAGVPVSGRIRIDRLTKDRLTLTRVSGQFDAGPAGIHLREFNGEAYGGRTGGNLAMTPAAGGTWDYTGNVFVVDARAEDVLGALTPIRGLEGRLRTRVLLSGRTGPAIDPIKALTLAGAGLVLDGTFVNIPAIEKVSRILKFKEGASERIEFRTLRHHVNLENGFVVIDTLKIAQPAADWDVGGRIGLDGTLDCPVTARLDPTMFQEGSDFRKAAEVLADADGRLALALHLGGTLTSPEVSVNLDPLVEAAKQSAREALTDELKKKLGGLLRKH